MNWRERKARDLVRRVSSMMETSYYWHSRHDFAASAKWARLSRNRQRWSFPLAKLLDRDAAVDQMVNEGWWG